MIWDFAETNPFNDGAEDGNRTDCRRHLGRRRMLTVARRQPPCPSGQRDAASLPEMSFDAIVTDPPYYDNVPYADISDFFYVWLKRTSVTLPGAFCQRGHAEEDRSNSCAHRGTAATRERRTQNTRHMMAQSFTEADRMLEAGRVSYRCLCAQDDAGLGDSCGGAASGRIHRDRSVAARYRDKRSSCCAMNQPRSRRAFSSSLENAK